MIEIIGWIACGAGLLVVLVVALLAFMSWRVQ
jgi:hypothetical protein